MRKSVKAGSRFIDRLSKRGKEFLGQSMLCRDKGVLHTLISVSCSHSHSTEIWAPGTDCRLCVLSFLCLGADERDSRRTFPEIVILVLHHLRKVRTASKINWQNATGNKLG